ncbi:MAG TPA: hypothetical protein VNN22_12600 [Verrucomicrobiae bacterium]|nr:hypothetical protein [Verrucomicrobiae bacterium]
MNASAKKTEWRQVAQLLVWVVGIYYVFSRFIPCTPVADYPICDDLDNAWAQALHVDFIRHVQFGTDVIFTYGPWGFLARGYYPPTYLISVVAWALLAVVYLGASWRLARHFSANWLVAWIWLVSFTAVVSVPAGADFNSRLVAFEVLLLLLHFFVEEGMLSLRQILLVVALGWLSLVKFTGLLESAAVVGIIAVDNIVRHKRFPLIVIWWLASLLLFWILAGQHINLLAPYCFNSWQMASGYTEAMMFDGKARGWCLGGYCLIAFLLCAFTGLIAWRRHRFRGALPVAGLGGILFLVFKLGFIRNDRHEIDSVMALLLVALACLTLAGPGKRQAAMMGLCLVIGASLLAGSVFNYWLPGEGLPKQLARTFGIYNLMAPGMSLSTGYMSGEYEKDMARAKKDFPLPSIQGGADIYSYEQNVLFANGWTYRPRPVMQSYCAYTPELARLNAAHLRTARAAENILFAIQPLDHRFPALDDGCSWPELMTRYDIKNVLGSPEKYLLLSRAVLPREYQLKPLAENSAHFGESVAVPAATNGSIWVEMDVDKTSLGTLASTIYKPPQLMLAVSLKDARELRFSLVPGMARSGFLLSPLIENIRSFAALAAGKWQSLTNLEITSMTISADTKSGATDYYQSPVRIRFYQLECPAQDLKIVGPTNSTTRAPAR